MRLQVLKSTPAHPPGPSEFREVLTEHGVAEPYRARVTTLQINVGKRCNQACLHCHVEAGPNRTETMDDRLARHLVELVARSNAIETVDITGGAPELNPSFRYLVQSFSELGRRVIDRCNLTILLEPGMEDLPDFLAAHRVEVTASLPCYGSDNVDKQRGKGVFERSIEGLKRLNARGYGIEGSGLPLDLVYNPGGAFLPPDQGSLESRYREELRALCGVEFSRLLTLTNMPINRFAHTLQRDGQYDQYMQLLRSAFNPGTMGQLMCLSQVSVGHDGRMYDCDFNQMLELPVQLSSEGAPSVWDLASFDALDGRAIATDDHCLGCTAGAGSSCGGALS